MRTGPFSSFDVIKRLNRSFVPVFAVNEDYRDAKAVPKEERDEYQRIYREALAKKFSAGSVHVYVLNPAGEVVGTRHVADAAKTKALIGFLDDMTKTLGTPSGGTLVAPKAQSRPPKNEPGSLVLHLAARGLGGGGSWDGTAENWIVYTRAEVGRLLLADVKPGSTWEFDRDLASRLLRYVYPVTENNDPKKNEIKEQALKATVIGLENGIATIRLDGRLVMRHDFYHKPDGKTVDAKLLGYVDYEPATGAVKAFRLVTDEATYGGGKFGVAVHNEP